jgi:KDO2-lipid IV(A) lauroyltransferase
VQWVGAQRLQAALDEGRGVLLMSPHVGAFEAVAQSYAERFGATHPMTALYRPARKAVLRELVAQARNRPGLVTVPAQLAGVRQMIRALRRGEAVGLLPDQVPPEGQGVWAPFFGRPAYTMTLAGRLLQQTGASALLLWCERLPAGRGYRVHVEDLPGALPQGDDALAWATAMNQAMEHVIRQCPQQYLWGYHRYKQPRPAAVEPPSPTPV